MWRPSDNRSVAPELSIEFLRSRRNAKWTQYGSDVLPVWVADMDFPVAPAVQAAVERLVDERDYGYPYRGVELADRVVADAFAHHEADIYGWQLDPALVITAADLVQATQAAILAFTEPGDGVLLQLPSYPPFISTIAATGRTLIANKMVGAGERWELDVDGIARQAGSARLMMLCSPHNPTGRVFSREELKALGRIAVDNDMVIVCDEIHSELTYPPHTHTPLAMIDEAIAARTVTITSATKAYNIAGLRCAVMHFGSPQLLDRFRRRIPDGLLGHISVFGIDATLAAWADARAWLAETLAQLAANRRRIGEVLAGSLPKVRYHEPEATYLAWLDFTEYGLRPSAAGALLSRARVGLSAGENFGDGYSDFARLNFATSRAILDEVLDRMCTALNDVG